MKIDTPDVIQKLFQEFTQADASISRKFGGTGLGLAISKRIIDQVGGAIRAGSVLGEGASLIFEVLLPKTDISALTDNRGRSTKSVFAKILANLKISCCRLCWRKTKRRTNLSSRSWYRIDLNRQFGAAGLGNPSYRTRFWGQRSASK